jgi:hypothetical protein
MQPFAGLFLHLLDRHNPAAQIQNLAKLLLNRLQPFLPLPVIDLSLDSIPPAQPVFLIQRVNFSDLGAKPRNLFPKNFQVIHVVRIPYLGSYDCHLFRLVVQF